MRPPQLDGPLAPHTVVGETVWVSRSGDWVVVPRRVLDRVGALVPLGAARAADTSQERLPARRSDAVVPPPAPASQERVVGWVLAAGATLLGLSLAVLVVSVVVLVGGGLLSPPLAAPAGVAELTPVAGGGDTGDEGAPARAPAAEVPVWKALVDGGHAVLPGDPALAAELFRRALTLAPTQARAHLGLGEALAALGDAEGGAASLCEARRLDRSLEAEVATALRRHRATCR